MKKSKYNIFAHWENFHIGINLITGKAIVFLDKEYEDYISLEKDNFEMKNRSLYANLISTGFIINDSTDEFARLIHKRNRDVFYNNNIYKLTILPTLSCNFNCWYCYEKHPKSIMKQQTFDKIKQYFNYILANNPMYTFNMDWFGGEPLMNFDKILYPLSLYMKDEVENRGLRFVNTITTNGFLVNDKMISKFNEINLAGFQITLDGYRETHDKVRYQRNGNGSFDTIINNINTICSSVDNANVNIRINYTNETICELSKITQHILSSNYDKIRINLQRVWQTIGKEEDVDDEIESEITLIENEGIQVQHNTYSYGKGCICYADSQRQSVVNYDGSLYKCTARDFTNPKDSVGYIDENGEPCWNDNYYKHFLRTPFDNPTCRDCEYVPACLGVCSQKFIEEGDDFLKKHCDKKSCSLTIERDLYNKLYKYISEQI